MTLFDSQTPAAAHALAAAAGTDMGPVAGEPSTPVGGKAAGPMPHVVGVDLSLAGTGIASLAGATTTSTAGKRGDTLQQRQRRLHHMRQRVVAEVSRHGDPDLIVIEGPSYSSKNPGSAHDRSGLWWLLIDVFTIRGWQVIEASPSTRMKYATGRGNASKDEVLAAAIKRLPIDVANHNEADAAWLAAIGHALLGDALAVLPETHRAALTVLRPQLEGIAS